MKKIIFGIFAHPDDEAFGPSGTLLKETKAGTELHLITLTAGDGGTNPDNHPDLGAVRLEEWHQAGQLLGASNMNFLGYRDGQLNNLAMIEIADRLIDLVGTALSEQPDDAVVEFMTLDLNGITGHIDHIVAARAACYAFYKLKESDTRFKRIRLVCVPLTNTPTSNIHWLYTEAGRDDSEIDEVVDARDLHDEIVAVMRTHHTQRGDGETHIKNQGRDLGLNYFLIKT